MVTSRSRLVNRAIGLAVNARMLHSLKRIWRRGIDNTPIDAFVLRASKQLILLQPVRDRIDLDGYDVVRRRDVTDIEDAPRAAFYQRALAIKRQRPKLPPGLDLLGMGGLFATLRKKRVVFVIHRETVAPDECEIGQIASLTRTSYCLRWLSPSAIWETDDRTFRLSEVSRVQFGCAYEKTLQAVAQWHAARPAKRDPS